MSREWVPGDVAMVTVDHGKGPRDVICFRTPGWWRDSTTGNSYGSALREVKSARPLVVIDPESDEDVKRLCDAYRSVDHGIGTMPMQAALREFADPKPPRCVAHGNEACADCSRIRTVDFEGGECRHCSTYGTDGMHWDTCSARIRGPVFANRAEAMGAKP
jgi:hypothetical protein